MSFIISGERLQVFVVDISSAVTDLMYDALLNLRIREAGINRLAEALEVVDTADQDVFNAPVARLVMDAQPKLSTLGLADLDPQDIEHSCDVVYVLDITFLDYSPDLLTSKSRFHAFVPP